MGGGERVGLEVSREPCQVIMAHTRPRRATALAAAGLPGRQSGEALGDNFSPAPTTCFLTESASESATPTRPHSPRPVG